MTPGARLGSYEILAPLGAGGMGEVYRARDTKLDRDVALKVLPEAVAADPQRIARLEREAKTLAALNHPNIAHIYGFEASDGIHALVMELVEGPTLADRIAQGAIPLDEALAIAKQIAEALEAAHEAGIVHRDLKPANVKLRFDGTVKVLDFGLAKALDPTTSAPAGVTQSPTLSLAATQAGLILGTAAYMAPEQARGKAADRRADIWAFGVVLFEMLTGRRAFDGDDLSITLASVLETEPDWNALPSSTPGGIRRLLPRCLQKDPRRRLPAIGEARIQIEDVLSGAPELLTPKPPPPLPWWRHIVPWAAASVFLAALAVLASMHFREAVPREVRLEITTPPTDNPASLALSPDGQKIVFTATSDGEASLWLRSLDSTSAKPLRGTEGGVYPFWSPDSRSIGFFAAGKLKRTDIEGGSVQVLANAPIARGGTWNRDGVILFAGRNTQPIFRVATTGDEPMPVTRVSATESGHLFPQFLPDGRHFLFYALGRPDTIGIYVGQLDGSAPQRLVEADTAAVYASPGYLLFMRQGTLFSQRFDPVRLTVTGDPTSISDQVAAESDPTAGAPVSASATGLIAFRSAAGISAQQFVWVDRSGTELGRIGRPDVARPENPALSPDGRRVVLDRATEGNPDVWVLDLSRGILTRLTSDPGVDVYPLWSRDGDRIVFTSNRQGVFDLYQNPASSAGMEEVLLATPLPKVPHDWSPDGRFLLYSVIDSKTGSDLWALPLEAGNQKPFPVAQTPANERWGQFSPDGKWVAYQSDDSGREEVYLHPFPGPGATVQVSTTGGSQARWRPDGKELFYVALDGRLMAVPISVAPGGSVLDPGTPVPLFATHIGPALRGSSRQNYMVSPDGQRFLMNAVVGEGPAAPITLILNWRHQAMTASEH
jgi:serine/threonine protein kinase